MMKQIKLNKWKHLLAGVLLSSLTLSLSAEPVKIMFLGDSITSGDAQLPTNPEANASTYQQGDNSHIPFEKRLAYRGMFSWLLKKEGYSIAGSLAASDYNESALLDFVGTQSKNKSDYNLSDNNDTHFDEDYEGHIGFTSAQILEKIKGKDAILSSNPDIVLLHIGTNDGSTTDINTTVNNVKSILDEIFEKNDKAKVLLARIIEARRVDVRNGAWQTKAFNDAIEAMALAYSNKDQIKMVDMESGAGMIYNPCGTAHGDMQSFHADSNNTYDLHPNAKGYKKMGQKWFDDLIASKWLPDIKAPVIELSGTNPIEVDLNSTYAELGAIVTDDYDENLSVEINSSKVIMTKEGNYTVTYNAEDTAHNKAMEVNRTVIVSKNPNYDGNANGIADAEELAWFDYNKTTQKATLDPVGFLAIDKPLSAEAKVDADTIALIHVVDAGLQAYISAKADGKITTGIKDGEIKDNTLKTGSFSTGSDATIKKENDKIFIEIKIILAKDDKLTIGGK